MSPTLKFFKKKGEFIYNFRCPFCKDSQKKDNKARGYIYKKQNNLFYKCHNCSYGTTFPNFLKRLDPNLYKTYIVEKFVDDPTNRNRNYKAPDLKTSTTAYDRFSAKIKEYEKINLPSILSLEEDHWVRKYVVSRNIPFTYLNQLFYAEDFKKFISTSFGQDKANTLMNNEPRLVIPFYNKDKEIIAVQGRSLLTSNLRYITIKVKEEEDKIFGLDRANLNSKLFVVEGPLDSLFLPNCIAVGGAELNSVLTKFPNAIYIFDNEPWNKEILANMARIIQRKGKIVIWPKGMEQKDINDMVLAGLNIEAIIDANTFSSLEANEKMRFWSK